MADEKYTTVGLGELLWDLLPSGKQLGGAPANFAYITSLLGDEGIPVSRVGQDSLGDEAVERLAKLGLSADFIQRDARRSTGTVKVEVGTEGQPRFEISEAVAWDFIESSTEFQRLGERADAVCFGSLAQRSATSRAAICSFVRATPPGAVRIFDVNLRQKFYSAQVIGESMELATGIKLNHEELPVIMRLLELEGGSDVDSAKRLLSLYDLKLVCVTRGSGGSLLISQDDCCEHLGLNVKVADTVGAGDAFTAALVYGFLRQQPLAEISEKANRVGAWVASQPGAMPAVGPGGLAQALAQVA